MSTAFAMILSLSSNYIPLLMPRYPLNAHKFLFLLKIVFAINYAEAGFEPTNVRV